jgi:hypothetical protein
MGLTLGKSRLGKTNSRSVEAFLRLGVGLAAGGHGGTGPGSSTTRTRMHSRAVSRTVSVATTLAQARVGSPGVLYVDRGVIVLNKPPGLVSQGTSRLAATRTSPLPLAPQALVLAPARQGSAFDDVLNGTKLTFLLLSIQYTVIVVGTEILRVSAPRISTISYSFFIFFTDLRQRFDLGENPYPVHRLDKVCLQ